MSRQPTISEIQVPVLKPWVIDLDLLMEQGTDFTNEGANEVILRTSNHLSDQNKQSSLLPNLIEMEL